MSDQTVNIIFNFSSNANQVINGVTQASAQLSQSLTSTTNIFNGFKSNLVVFQQASQLIQGFKSSIDSAIQPGIQLNTSLQDLSAITGITGKGLKEIEGYARQSAKTFGILHAVAEGSPRVRHKLHKYRRTRKRGFLFNKFHLPIPQIKVLKQLVACTVGNGFQTVFNVKIKLFFHLVMDLSLVSNLSIIILFNSSLSPIN